MWVSTWDQRQRDFVSVSLNLVPMEAPPISLLQASPSPLHSGIWSIAACLEGSVSRPNEHPHH